MNPRRANRRIRLLAAALAALPFAASALQSDRQQPMDIAADSTDAVLADTGDAHLRGNVTISQGSLKIAAAEATVSRQAGEIRRAVLTGSPATVEQALDAGGRMQARANSIDYDMAANVLLLRGNVVVTQPEGELRGEQVRYELASGKVEGGAPGSRVQMRIAPKPAAAAKPAD